MIFLGETISAFYSGKLIDIYGRLNILKYSLFTGSLFLFLFNCTSSNLLRCIFIFLSMMGYTSHYSMIGVFINETFPTCIRSLMYSYLKLFSRFGPLIAPFLSEIFEDNINYCFIISGFIGFFVCFHLEETKGKELQDNMMVSDVLKPYYDIVKNENDIVKKMYIDMHFWLPQDILLKADKMTMANSLELRVPLLDRVLFDYAKRIPTKYLVKNKQTKYIFRDIANEVIPEEWAKRRKLGFPVPFSKWIREEKYYIKLF